MSGLEEADGLCQIECKGCLLFFTTRTVVAHRKYCTGDNAPIPFVVQQRNLRREIGLIELHVSLNATRNHGIISQLQHNYNVAAVEAQLKLAVKQQQCQHDVWKATGRGVFCKSCGMVTNKKLYEDGEVAEEEASPHRTGVTLNRACALDAGVVGEDEDEDEDDDEDEDEEMPSCSDTSVEVPSKKTKMN